MRGTAAGNLKNYSLRAGEGDDILYLQMYSSHFQWCVVRFPHTLVVIKTFFFIGTLWVFDISTVLICISYGSLT